ncbi:MAG TPA: isocitrate lyase/phosphoenolpyruvate mutase family protein [Nevskia sp.]|nr:isocitrate lyase/phosphoenolpyruvate mutase family protein [Nevskia sp.]
MPSPREKYATMRQLHESGCFVIPNPWDVGSARYLQSLGFKALATTSSGAAWSMGSPDNDLSLAMALAHIQTIVEATELPVNADFEGGFAPDAHGVARNVALCVATGAASLSIEDSTRDPRQPLRELPDAVERMRAARESIDERGGGPLLVGRAECFLTGHPTPLQESVKRLRAYAEAGADVLYAPGVRTREEIAELVAAAAPRPLNVLANQAMQLSVDELAALGVRRISVGGALARAAWGGFMRAAEEIARQGTFTALKDAASGAVLDQFFTQDQARRG